MKRIFGAIFPLFLLAAGATKDWYVLVNDGSLNIRSEGNGGKVIGKASRGQKVQVDADVNEPGAEDFVMIQGPDIPTGYVSAAYLGIYPPEKLDSAGYLGLLYAAGENSPVSPEAIWDGKDFLRAPSDGDFAYKMRKARKLKTINLTAGTAGPEITGDGTMSYGCQARTHLKVKRPELAENSQYLVFEPQAGFEPLTSDTLAENSALYKEIYKLAETRSKTLKIPAQEWKRTVPLEPRTFEAHNKVWVSVRFTYADSGVERRYLYILAEKAAATKPLRLVYSASESLDAERGAYGGPEHFIGGFRTGKRVFLYYYDTGFDSHASRITELYPDKTGKSVTTHGDAC